MTKKRAAIYVRTSSEAQAGEGRTSPKTQEADCRALAEREGYEIVAVVRDLKKYRNAKGQQVEPSGSRLDRPGFQKILALARAGEIDIIMAWHLNRLVRGHYPIAELYELHQEVPELDIVLAQGGFDWHHFGLLGSIAHMEREDMKIRLRRARLESARRGVRQGGPPPFGYERDAAGIVVSHPDETAALLRLFELYASGATHKRILATLDAEKHFPRSGKRWARGTLISILARASKYNDGVFPYEFDDERFESIFDPILPDELFLRVASRQEAGRAHRPKWAHKLPALCRGLLYDGCGVHREWKMILQWRGRPAGSVYRCAVGKNHYLEGLADTHVGSIGMQKMDRFVWDAVTERYFDPERARAQVKAEMEAIQNGQPDQEAELAKIDKLLGAHDEKRQEYLRL